MESLPWKNVDFEHIPFIPTWHLEFFSHTFFSIFPFNKNQRYFQASEDKQSTTILKHVGSFWMMVQTPTKTKLG